MAQQAPASIEAEEAVLGSMLIYPQTVTLAYDEGLQPGHFFLDANRKIFQVILALYDEKKPVDLTSVITRLSDLGQLNNVGGADYLAHLTDIAISSTNSDYYIQDIEEKAVKRKLIETTEDIRQKAYDGQYSAYDVLNEAESSILKLSRERKTSDWKTAKETFNEAIRLITERSKQKSKTGVPSGFKYLDDITDGFHKSDLIILAARPAVGKTAFALNIASNAAVKSEKSVALFSLEMPAIQLANRMLAAESSVNLKKISTGQRLTNEDWARIDDAKSRLEKAKIYIDDSSLIKVNDISAKCRKLKNEGNLDLVIIDYLQLITGNSTRNENRTQEVSDISRGLKLLARELEVPVICLSQLSREVENQAREPMLSDLRESGAIEQDADLVMFLHPHREKARKNDKDDEEEQSEQTAPVVEEKQRNINLIIAKHRNGATGRVSLAFEGGINKFFTKEYRQEENI